MYDLLRNSVSEYGQLVRLYKECFNIKTTIKKIRSKYNTIAFGSAHIGYFAISDQNERAAYYGVFPLKLKFDNKIVLGAQSGDTMTSPLHQKRGLFVLLANATYQLCKQNGINIVFGFPNANSYPGFVNKLGWVFYGNMQKFIITIYTLPISEIAYRVNAFSPVYNFYTNLILKKYKTAVLPYMDHFNFGDNQDMVYKDESFFKYKMANSNCFAIKINQYVYFLKIDGHLIIGDIAYDANFDISKCMAELKYLAKKLLCRKIDFYLSDKHWLYNHLNAVLTPETSLPIGFKLMEEGLNCSKFKFSAIDFDTF